MFERLKEFRERHYQRKQESSERAQRIINAYQQMGITSKFGIISQLFWDELSYGGFERAEKLRQAYIDNIPKIPPKVGFVPKGLIKKLVDINASSQ